MTGAQSEPGGLRGTLAALLFVSAAAALPYLGVLDAPFHFDDFPALPESPAVKSLVPGPDLWAAPQSTLAGRPVAALSFALGYALWGLETTGHRLVNIIVHLLAAQVLFALLRRTLRNPRCGADLAPAAGWLAAVCAAAWAAHPLQTESVTYIVQRVEALMGLFYLLTLYCSVRAFEGGSRGWTVAAAVCCLLGMGTKEVMVTAPVVVLLYDRCFISRSWGDALRAHRLHHLALSAGWILLAVLVIQGPRSDSAGFSQSTVGWADYALTQPEIILHYLRLTVIPEGLCLDYGWRPVPTWADALPALAVLVALLLVSAVLALRGRPAGCAAASFFLILSPTSSIVPILDLCFEHRLYLPLAPLLAFLLVGLYTVLRRFTRRGIVAFALVGVPLVAGLGVQAAVRNRVYRSAEALWRDVVEKRPENARGHRNLGKALFDQGRLAEAEASFLRSIALAPVSRSHRHLSLLYAAQGRWEEALPFALRAVQLAPGSAEAMFELGNVLHELDQPERAAAAFEAALRLDGESFGAHYNLGNLLRVHGRLPQAIHHLERAVAIDPDALHARWNLAATLELAGRIDEARARFAALAEVARRVSARLRHEDRPEEALEAAQIAVQAAPDQAASYLELAHGLAALGRAAEAAEAARQALEREPGLTAAAELLEALEP